LFSISAAVATATDVTVEELAIESFYPADAETAAAFSGSPAFRGSRAASAERP